MFGTSIRDVAVILFRNIAKWKVAGADSIWNYPAAFAVDGDPESMWLSRHGVTQTHMTIDLGEPINLAGLAWNFGFGGVNHGAGRIRITHSLNGVDYDQTLEL